MNNIPIKIKIETYDTLPNVPGLMLFESGSEVENLVAKTKPTIF